MLNAGPLVMGSYIVRGAETMFRAPESIEDILESLMDKYLEKWDNLVTTLLEDFR